ncbi:MAG TPA: DUF748 domain-containing protein [Verrucomicrobiae bacterium]|jgi:Domain of Unknown Function (DUF748).
MAPSSKTEKTPSARRRRGRKWLWILLVVVVMGIIVRALLPGFVRDYVNRTLDRNPLYSGEIGAVEIHLWRGAYSIHDIRLSKTSGNVPVPLFAARRVDFAIQWNALLHHHIVGRISIDQPELNFVDAPSDAESQSGEGGPWLQMIRDLFPFTINSAVVQNGSVHFRAYQTEKPLDVYLSKFNASVENLSNVRDELNPLAATMQASATVMDDAKLQLKMTLDPFSYRPTFHLALRLLGLDVTKVNELALAYGKFDFKRGWFDLVVEADSKEGLMTGYIKPLFRDLKIFSLSEDIKEDNVLQFFWQALIGATTSVLKNRPRDQFGTLIPFSGDATKTTTADILATIGNLLRNAFVRAYLPRLEGGQSEVDGLKFGAPEFTEALSTSDAAQ